MSIKSTIAAVAATPLLVSGGPTVTHTETADEFGDVEFIGYLGGSYDKFYGEISGVTNVDDVDWSAYAGVKFTF